MKTLKKLLFVLCLLPIGIQGVKAQINVILNVNNSTNSSKLSDWTDDPNIAMLTIVNSQPDLAGTEYKIFATLELNGKKIAETIKESMPIRTLEESSETINLSDVISFNSLRFFGNTKKEATATGYLPPGNYLLCVSLLKTNGEPLMPSTKVCASVFLTDYHMPELIFPKDISISKEILRGTMFNWSAVTPNPSPEMGLKYIIAITEVQEGQSPAVAFSVNRPIIQEEVENITSFNWPTDIETEAGKKYVWSVKPVREDGSAYKNTNNGYVAFATFQTKKELTPDIDDKDSKNKNICDCSKKIVPKLTLVNPDSTNVRKLEMKGVEALKRALLTECNRFINKDNTIVDVQIGWKGEEKPNYASDKKTYEYMGDEIPEKVFVKAIMLPSNGAKFKDEVCEKTFYVDLPENLKMEPKNDLIFYSNCGGNTKFEFKANKKDVKKDVTTNTFSGKGTVFIKWLNARVAVKLLNVKLNEESEMIAGEIQSDIAENAPRYPVSWGVEATNNSNWVNDIAKGVTDWIKDKTGKSIPYKSATKKIKPVKMPLGLNFKQGADQLAITEMQFTKDKALLNIIAAKSIPQSWNSSVEIIGFLAKNIEFTQSDITTFRRIELVEDIICNNTNSKIDFTFKKPYKNVSGRNDSGCYIEWSENGFSRFGLQLECRFSKDWLKPTDGKDKVIAQLATEASDWDNLIFEGSLSPAEIVGTNGMRLSAKNISYDMSDTQNAQNIKFPNGYEGDKTNTFRGFYAKNISIKMPKTITESTGKELSINAKDLLIDDMGITLNVEVSSENDSGFGEVSIADLSANINSAKVKIVSSSLAEAGFGGKIKLPISSSFKFDYEAMLHTAEKSNTQKEHIALTIKTPKKPIKAELFNAQLKLGKNTVLSAYLDEDNQRFKMNVNGTLSFKEKVSLGKLDFNLPGIKVQNMKIFYDQSKHDFEFYEGTWAFASPQKSIESFAFSISDVGFEKLQKKQGEKFRGKLKIGGKINLAKAVSGKTTLGITGAIDDDFKPKYIGTKPDKVRVRADLSVVNIDGLLEFFENDEVYGDGFHGEFGVLFTPIDLGAEADIYFGKKDDYSYWAVEADAILPEPGIPFLGGLSFRKFGGGAYYNMDFHTTPVAYKREKRRFTPNKPSKGSKIGFLAKTTIATTAEESNFNTDATLRAEINTEEGLTMIGFTGECWAGGGLSDASRKGAYAKGIVNAEYDFTQSVFSLDSNVTIDKKKDNGNNIIHAEANLDLEINGNTGKWYIHMGEPEQLCEVKVFDIGGLYGYFMVGNDKVYPPRRGFTERFISGYSEAMGEEPTTRALSISPAVTTGAGISLGIGWDFKAEVSGWKETSLFGCDICVPDFPYHGKVMAGAELNLALLKYNDSKCKGFNGWRARGSIGVYGLAKVYVGWQPFKSSYGIRGAAWLMGEFPNPTYATGKLKGEVFFAKAWWGISPSFEYGELCNTISNKEKKEEKKKRKEEEKLSKFYNSPFLSPKKACNFFAERSVEVGSSGSYMGVMNISLMEDVNCETATEEEICRSINKLYHRYVDPPKVDPEKAKYYGGSSGSYTPKPNWRSVAIGKDLRKNLLKIKTVFGRYDFVTMESCMKCFRDHKNELARIREEDKLEREKEQRAKEEDNKRIDEKISTEELITDISPEENGSLFNNISRTYMKDNPISVSFKYQPNKIFAVRVRYKDGTSAMRKYRLSYQVAAKEYEVDQWGNGNIESGKPIELKTFVNNFGETCFYHEKTEVTEPTHTIGNVNLINMINKYDFTTPVKESANVYTSSVTPVQMTTNATIQNINNIVKRSKSSIAKTQIAQDIENDSRFEMATTTTVESFWKPNKGYEFNITAKLEVLEITEEVQHNSNTTVTMQSYNWKTVSSNNLNNTRRIYFNTVKK